MTHENRRAWLHSTIAAIIAGVVIGTLGAAAQSLTFGPKLDGLAATITAKIDGIEGKLATVTAQHDARIAVIETHCCPSFPAFAPTTPAVPASSWR
ncbi:MAG: hypothetical protein ACYDAR_14250 [Thermomicrobiales bacterium]